MDRLLAGPWHAATAKALLPCWDPAPSAGVTLTLLLDESGAIRGVEDVDENRRGCVLPALERLRLPSAVAAAHPRLRVRAMPGPG